MSRLLRCRIAACPEKLDDGKAWSFYLINDGAAPIDSATLLRVDTEWGDRSYREVISDAHVVSLAPNAFALLWRDDGGNAEFRMELSVRMSVHGGVAELVFEFPKLYLQRHLQRIEPLGKIGWAAFAEAPAI